MRVSVSVRVTLKDKPPGYQGITSELYNIGKIETVTFSDMVLGFAQTVADFYTLFSDVDEMNAELDLLRDKLENVRFRSCEEKNK